MPRQLDRIWMAKEYHNHPLRKEYEAKKAEITKKNKSILYYLLRVFSILSYIMIPGYFILFLFNDIILDRPGLVILLGIINLIVAFFSFVELDCNGKLKSMQESRNKDELNKLKNEYDKKGLYEFTEKDLLNSVCVDKDYDGDPICGITGAYIGYGQKYRFCKVSGNCQKCKTFMKAYLGNDWDGEYEME